LRGNREVGVELNDRFGKVELDKEVVEHVEGCAFEFGFVGCGDRRNGDLGVVDRRGETVDGRGDVEVGPGEIESDELIFSVALGEDPDNLSEQVPIWDDPHLSSSLALRPHDSHQPLPELPRLLERSSHVRLPIQTPKHERPRHRIRTERSRRRKGVEGIADEGVLAGGGQPFHVIVEREIGVLGRVGVKAEVGLRVGVEGGGDVYLGFGDGTGG
jgi:hypothetical protein